MGRQETAYHKVKDESEIILSEKHYNALGQLIENRLHSADEGESFKQHVDYDYNIRGLGGSRRTKGLFWNGAWL
jgi:hypothetical protein